MTPVSNNLIQKLVAFTHARRPQWQFLVEDSLLRVMCQQYIVDWTLISQISETFKVNVRDVTSHHTFGIVITFQLPAGE
jgi:hypothetical protein